VKDIKLFPIAYYGFSFIVIDRVYFTKNICASLRGIIFSNLKGLFCEKKGKDCGECDYSSKCPVSGFFEITRDTKRYRDYPRPVVLRVDEPLNVYEASSDFEFSLGLLSKKSIDDFPYIFSAIKHIENTGIGSEEEKKRGKVKLISAYFLNPLNNEKKILYFYKENIFNERKLYIKKKEIIERAKEISKGKRIKIEFLTPLAITYEKKIMKDFSFPLFIERLYERINKISELSLKKPLDINVPPLDSIKILYKNFTYYNSFRYSTRKGSYIPLNGIIGEAVISGRIDKIAVPLVIGELIHVGKHTTSGFGRYKLSVL